MATTYTIALANAKPGSIVVTPSVINNSNLPQYYLNLKTIKLEGSNPFLADNVTLNPFASFSLFCKDTGQYLIKDIPMSSITAIGGVATPATLILTMVAIAALIAE